MKTPKSNTMNLDYALAVWSQDMNRQKPVFNQVDFALESTLINISTQTKGKRDE